MANIILPKYKEVFVENKMLVKGEWKIEIVHPNGEVSQPFGDKMRPNLIQDTGLRFLVGHDRSAFSFDGGATGLRHARGIPDVISHAVYSSNAANPTATNYRGNTIAPSADGGWTSRNTTGTCTRVDIADGCVYTKVWDFNAVQTGQHTVREISIGMKDNGGGFPVQESGYGRPTNFILFSRFVLPSNTILDTFQFLRLTYTLQVSIPALVTPIEVPNITSGSFSTLGKMKAMGRYRDFLGEMGTNGISIEKYYASIGSFTLFAWINPWALLPCTEDSLGYAAAALMGADDEFGNNALNINDYPSNTALPNTIGTTKSATRLYTNVDIGGSITNNAYTAGSNTASKSAAVFFPATIPNVSRWIGGLFFTPTLNRYNGNPYIPSDPFSIGLDGNGRGFSHGWLYNFYDALGNKRGQFKDINFALRFNYTQTVSR